MEGSTSNPTSSEPKGKILNLWSRCIANPMIRIWSHVDFKQKLACAAVRKIDMASKVLKRLPEVSLSCHVSASFSVNSANSAKNGQKSSDFDDFEKRERCRKIAEIEYEIRNLERHLERRGTGV